MFKIDTKSNNNHKIKYDCYYPWFPNNVERVNMNWLGKYTCGSTGVRGTHFTLLPNVAKVFVKSSMLGNYNNYNCEFNECNYIEIYNDNLNDNFYENYKVLIKKYECFHKIHKIKFESSSNKSIKNLLNELYELFHKQLTSSNLDKLKNFKYKDFNHDKILKSQESFKDFKNSLSDISCIFEYFSFRNDTIGLCFSEYEKFNKSMNDLQCGIYNIYKTHNDVKYVFCGDFEFPNENANNNDNNYNNLIEKIIHEHLDQGFTCITERPAYEDSTIFCFYEGMYEKFKEELDEVIKIGNDNNVTYD